MAVGAEDRFVRLPRARCFASRLIEPNVTEADSFAAVVRSFATDRADMLPEPRAPILRYSVCELGAPFRCDVSAIQTKKKIGNGCRASTFRWQQAEPGEAFLDESLDHLANKTFPLPIQRYTPANRAIKTTSKKRAVPQIYCLDNLPDSSRSQCFQVKSPSRILLRIDTGSLKLSDAQRHITCSVRLPAGVKDSAP